MLTPRFTISQDDCALHITIRAPYCNLRDLDTYVDGQDFRFVCSPYYLRLNLPGRIVDAPDSSDSHAKFDAETGHFTFTYRKETQGQHFAGLDFITSLLAPPSKKTRASGPDIQVLSTSTDHEEEECWHFEQKATPAPSDLVLGHGYGFAHLKFGTLDGIEAEFCSVFDVTDARNTGPAERLCLMRERETSDFSPDHYVADLHDPGPIDDIVRLPSPKNTEVKFSGDEIDVLKELPNREYLLDGTQTWHALLGLLDILYAHCYDRRTTYFEGTCESGWTVTKLSATLSWFCQFGSACDVKTSAFRRSLIYPLYRSLALCDVVWEDACAALRLGPVHLVRCLLEVHGTFIGSAEPRYLLNDLYIKDYIVFLQKCPAGILDRLAQEAETATTLDLNLGLDGLSAIPEDEPKLESLLQRMARLDVAAITSDDDDTTTSTEDSDDDDSTDTATPSPHIKEQHSTTPG